MYRFTYKEKHMKKHKPSGPAIFMYSVIAGTILIWSVCFGFYYSGATENDVVLWIGIVAFMIMYHFWVRIIMGNVSKLFVISPDHPWFCERKFEKKLYKLLRVRNWKDKVLTYNPEQFDFSENSLDSVLMTTCKAEVDHLINEVISLSSLLFSLLWGQFPIFLVTAVAAMAFDAQFIFVQRYNRPKIRKIMTRRKSIFQKNTAQAEKV